MAGGLFMGSYPVRPSVAGEIPAGVEEFWGKKKAIVAVARKLALRLRRLLLSKEPYRVGVIE